MSKMKTAVLLSAVSILSALPVAAESEKSSEAACCPPPQKKPEVDLGNFSVSLTVKDLEASRVFYEKLGFGVFAGDASKKWLIMKNNTATIGLFQGMFDKNVLTFNPGWDKYAQPLPSFTDVRELQKRVKAQGVKLTTEADEKSKGPASFTVEDPDGNQVLVDQHVDAPQEVAK